MSIRILVPIGVLALTLCCESAQAQNPGTPLSSSAASTQLQGKTGSIRSSAIAQVAPFLKADLTGQETADILGTANELSEAPRANAILSIARATKLGALGAEAALMLKGATGNNRSMAIAEIAPYLKIGLTGQETAEILGAANELSEAPRANAILSIARAKKLAALGAEAALMLKATTGNNRSMAINEIAPYLKIGLTGQETVDILGTANELSEAPRANAILFIARAGKVMPGLTEGELAPVLAGMTGSNRALALSELHAAASPSAASVGGIATRPPSPQPVQSTSAAAPTSTTSRSESALLARIENLERQLNGLPLSAVRTRGSQEAALARSSLLRKAPEDARRHYETGREYQELALNIQADSAKWGLLRTGQSRPSAENLPRYGWWGGKGWSGGRSDDRQPINTMDRIFRQHDEGYRAAGSDATKIRSADEALVRGLLRIDRDALSNEQLFRDVDTDLLYLDAAILAFSAKIAASFATG